MVEKQRKEFEEEKRKKLMEQKEKEGEKDKEKKNKEQEFIVETPLEIEEHIINGDKVIKYCSSCEIGYYIDRSDGNCKSYSGNSNNSKRNEVRNAFLILLFAMIL